MQDNELLNIHDKWLISIKLVLKNKYEKFEVTYVYIIITREMLIFHWIFYTKLKSVLFVQSFNELTYLPANYSQIIKFLVQNKKEYWLMTFINV